MATDVFEAELIPEGRSGNNGNGRAVETPDRRERIAAGVALIRGGHSTRAAAAQVGIPQPTLWRAANRYESLQAEEPGELDRIVARSRVTVDMGLDRMLSEIATVDPKYLAGWLTAAARIGGLIGAEPSSGLMGDVLSQLSGTGGTVEVGTVTRVTVPAPERVAGGPDATYAASDVASDRSNSE